MTAALIRLARLPYGVLGTVSTLAFDGDTIEMAGRIEPVEADHDDDARALLAVRRDQLLGLGEAWAWDAPHHPIVALDDPSLTGMYGDWRVKVDADHLGVGHFAWSLTARRVLGRDAPGFELEQVGGHRINDHSITAGSVTPWFGVPAAVTDFYAGESGGSTFALSRTSDTGAVGIYRYSTTGVNRRLAAFHLPTVDHYDGAALIELGEDRHPVTGRQVWDTSAASNLWRVGNGLVRVSQSTTTPGALYVERYHGGAWSGHTYTLSHSHATTPATIDAMSTFSVLVNTPEVVTVRVGLTSGSLLHRHLLDITVRRGSLAAEMVWRTDLALLGRVTHSPTAGSSKLTTGGGADYGLAHSSGTAPRWAMMQPSSQAEDTTAEWIARAADAATWAFMIGATDSSTTTTGMRDEYFGVNECYQQVVGR